MMLRLFASFLALFLLLAPAPGFAQTAKPKKKTPAKTTQPTVWPIKTLSVEGNHNYTKEQILAVAGLKIGQLAGKADFEAARDRLIASGAFETVGYRFTAAQDSNSYAASFQVVEVGQMYPVIIVGLPIQLADLNAWLKTKDPMYNGKLPGTAEMLKRYTALVEEYLASKNQSQKVIGKLAPSGVDQYGVVFRSAAPIPTIAEVKFTGSKIIEATRLQNRIAEVAIGFPYTEEGFRGLLNTSVRPLYDARGRVAVAFPKLSTEKAEDVDGLVVDVTIDEGAEYKLGEVKIMGNYAGKSAELLRIGKFKSGEVANFDEINAGVERIKKPLQRQGYMHVATTVDRALNEKNKTVDLTIHIENGPQYLMGKLTIEGLDLNGTAGIRKLWGPQEGKPFDADYPDYFLRRVKEDGLFEHLHDSKATTKVDEKNHTVDVTLQFH
jgi:outer membrane protein assembly factor BamA